MRRLSLWERLLIKLIPSRRKAYEQGLRDYFRYMLAHADEPFIIQE
jgi:hypothetical protein